MWLHNKIFIYVQLQYKAKLTYNDITKALFPNPFFL